MVHRPPGLRWFFLLFVTGLISWLGMRVSFAENASDRPLEEHLDLVYARYGDRELQLDLFRQEGVEKPRPVIVGIHGGGWQRGTRRAFHPLMRELAQRGFVTVSISYRLSDEASFPAQIHDCKAAVRWLRAHAETYGIDPEQIGVIGHSAGGHLAALLATSGGVAELEGEGGSAGMSSRVQACVAMGAQTDTLTDRIRERSESEAGLIWRKFLGGTQVERPGWYRLASPLHHLTPDDPPLALVTGELDDPSTRGQRIREQLKSYHIGTGLTVIPKAPHAMLRDDGWRGQAVEAAAEFFETHLTSPEPSDAESTSQSAVNEVATPSDQPNVIVILVDDQGYYDLGCYGASEVETPRIDALAREGIRFTDYYAAAPICSPSRAGLLTGCYPRRVGLATWVQRADSSLGLHPDELTLAELFRGAGYATACIGKWHLGFHEPFLPQSQGFDHYFGLLHNLDPIEVMHFEKEGGVPLLRGREVVERPADPNRLARQYTDEAISFVEQHKDEPFFIYLPHTMLHVPLGVDEAFRGSSQFGVYGDAIQEMDHHVGRLIDTLKHLELDERTIVVYVSDNGRGPGRNKVQPLRGRKLTTYEAGIRVPAIVWGAGIAGGRTSHEVVHAMDWYPSLASLAGIRLPADVVIDGRDISPLLSGETDIVIATEEVNSLNGDVPFRRRWDPPVEWNSLFTREEYLNAFFYHGSQGALAAVRWKQWKLNLNPMLQLYNLDEDPGELKPVRNGQMTRKLRGMVVLFQEEMQRDGRPVGDIAQYRLSASPSAQP